MTKDNNEQGGTGAKEQVRQETQHGYGIERDRQIITEARKKGTGASLLAFVRLSGPGWMQSGITVGGATFASSLYLGVLSGFNFMWYQPIAMILGIVMLGSIAYITLSTGKRPLREINKHISPVLGWSWLFAAMAANLVWTMPQYTLATAAVQQNLFPNIFGATGIPDPWGKVIIIFGLLAISVTVTMFYGSGGRGVKIFEIITKTLVSMVVLCFLGVIIKLTFMEGGIDWGTVLKGFIPKPGLLFRPTDGHIPYLQAVSENYRSFWTNIVVSQQRDVLVSALAATVGINMTFLFPYSMLRKGWDRDFRGLAIFDLSTGLFIPFVLASGFVIMAAASQFYTNPAPGFVPQQEGGIVEVEPAANLVGPYKTILTNRIAFEIGEDAVAALSPEAIDQRINELPYADKRMAATLVKRDNFNLAETLTPLTGNIVAQYIFGLGVMGLGLSAATMLMAINGLCLCELLNKPTGGWTQRIGSLMVTVGAFAAIFWKQPAPWLSIVTSAFCMILLPIAYVTFILMMNHKEIMGDNMPQGGKRVILNIAMAITTVIALGVSLWSLWPRLGAGSILLFGGFIALVLVVHYARKGQKQPVA